MPARADDLADQAELEFSLGVDAYQRGEYKLGFEHFLISNRLVANKNVLFNIARSYEQLKTYPAAFRYYSLALESETEPDAKAKINTALAQIKQYVMVLRVTTRPAGATLYIDRKDLGARGASPQLLGLAPHAYKLIAEYPGYEPAVVDVPATAPGQETRLDLALVPILGDVSFSGEVGTRVSIDGEADSAACTIPCTRSLAAGTHVARFAHAGFHSTRQTFTVRARSRAGIRTSRAADGQSVDQHRRTRRAGRDRRSRERLHTDDHQSTCRDASCSAPTRGLPARGSPSRHRAVRRHPSRYRAPRVGRSRGGLTRYRASGGCTELGQPRWRTRALRFRVTDDCRSRARRARDLPVGRSQLRYARNARARPAR